MERADAGLYFASPSNGFGQKTGKGWYLYESDNGRPRTDPVVDALTRELAAGFGIERRTIDAREIIERTHLPMIEEGYRLLEEGVVERSSDIDVVWVHGYGFPRDLGGPIYWHEHLRTTV